MCSQRVDRLNPIGHKACDCEEHIESSWKWRGYCIKVMDTCTTAGNWRGDRGRGPSNYADVDVRLKIKIWLVFLWLSAQTTSTIFSTRSEYFSGGNTTSQHARRSFLPVFASFIRIQGLGVFSCGRCIPKTSFADVCSFPSFPLNDLSHFAPHGQEILRLLVYYIPLAQRVLSRASTQYLRKIVICLCSALSYRKLDDTIQICWSHFHGSVSAGRDGRIMRRRSHHGQLYQFIRLSLILIKLLGPCRHSHHPE